MGGGGSLGTPKRDYVICARPPRAKMGGVGVIETVLKMGGAHRDKNWWNSLWQKWVELTVAKMGGTNHGKNGLSWCYRD